MLSVVIGSGLANRGLLIRKIPGVKAEQYPGKSLQALNGRELRHASMRTKTVLRFAL